jgi:molybdate/tungstate transport system ATP-binding protein
VLGPSGSGKTTLLSLVAGIIDQDSGTISLHGSVLDGQSLQQRQTGLVFQDGALFPHMTARENIAYGASDPERVADLADLLEIADVLDRRPPALSGGERKRVALARTLAADPAVLLLDEPLSSLDAPIRRRLRRELPGLFASLDIPVIYVTHDQQTATAVGDRTAVFRDGAIEQVGSPASVINRPATRFVARFTGNENLFEAAPVDRVEDGAVVCVDDLRLQTTCPNPPETGGTVSIHPSRIRIHAQGAAVDAGCPNTASGTVDRWLHEGDRYRVAVDVADAPLTLTATIRPPRFDQLAVAVGSSVRVTIPPDSIHFIDQ